MLRVAQRQAQREARWRAAAQRCGWWTWLLAPLSWVYAGLMAARAFLYARGVFTTEQMPVPVIVVGNVVVGGAGKTPVVMALIEHLRTQGWHPGVISRGYGRRSHGVTQVQGHTLAEQSADEPALIHRSTGVPVFVGSDRVAAARALLRACPEVNVLISDDGLQHWALGRDIGIAVFDERGCGNGWLLPAGILREPWPAARHGIGRPQVLLKQSRPGRAPPCVPALPDMSVFTATRCLAPYGLGPAGQRIDLAQLQGQQLTAVAGIAQPEIFFDMLRAKGLSLASQVALPDHVQASVYAHIEQSTPGVLLCTEKDAVKWFAQMPPEAPNAAPRVWAVPLQFQPDPAFFTHIEDRLRACRAEPPVCMRARRG